MRRLLLTLGMIVGLSGTAFAQSWTSVDADSAFNAGAGTSIATPGMTVSAGNAVVAFVGVLSDTTTITVCDDGGTCAGGHALTCLTTNAIAAQTFQGRFCYLLSSTASGTNSVVYTATFGGSVTERGIIVRTFSYTGTASLLTEDHTGQGFGTAVDSGLFTVSGSTDFVTLGGTHWGSPATTSSPLINGAAATGETANAANSMWYLAGTSGYSNATAAVTLSAGGWWAGSAITLSATAGGGPTCRGSLLLLGVGGC